jgi:hypothetical protein
MRHDPSHEQAAVPIEERRPANKLTRPQMCLRTAVASITSFRRESTKWANFASLADKVARSRKALPRRGYAQSEIEFFKSPESTRSCWLLLPFWFF